MTVFGFRNRRTARNAASATRQDPPRTIVERDNPGRGCNWVAFAPSDGIPARVGNKPGSADCDIFSMYVDDLVQLPNGTSQMSLPVYNVSTVAIPANTMVPCWQVGGRFITSASDGASSPDVMRFKTTSKMTNRQVAAVIEYIGSGPASIGDAVVVNDPVNLFPDVEAGATGSAYWHAGYSRWEIEDCSLPINEIRVKLVDACLYKYQSNSYGYFGDDPIDWNRADEPNNDWPPEAVFVDGARWRLDFDNPHGLDAPIGEYVICRRVTNRQETDPSNTTVPKAGSATAATWEAVAVSDIIARWICVEKTSASIWTYLGTYWEGGNPNLCGNVADKINQRCISGACVEDGSVFIACYDPENDKYIPVSSASALLGDPQQKVIPTGAPVLDPDRCADGEWCWNWPTTNVLVYECDEAIEGGPDPIEQCINGYEFYECTNLCEYICTYCDQFADYEDCGPCVHSCTYEFTGGAWSLLSDECDVTTDCICGDPPALTGNEEEGDTITVRCQMPMADCCSFDGATFAISSVAVVVTTDDAVQITASLVSLDSVGLDGSGNPTVTFTARWSDGGACGGATTDVTGNTATLKSATEGASCCCYWEVTMADPGSGQIGGCTGKTWNNADPWNLSTNTFKVPTCGGAAAPSGCNESDPCLASSYCDEAGFDTVLFTCNLSGSCAACCTPAEMQPPIILTASEPAPDLSSFGKYFYQSNPDLFRGCGCKRDVIPLLDRAGAELRPDTRERVIKLLDKKNPGFTAEQIATRLENARQSWISLFGTPNE